MFEINGIHSDHLAVKQSVIQSYAISESMQFYLLCIPLGEQNPRQAEQSSDCLAGGQHFVENERPQY